MRPKLHSVTAPLGCNNIQNLTIFLHFGIDTSMMPYMSDDGMSEDSSVVGMPQGRYNSGIVGKERYGITRDSRAVPIWDN